MGAKGRRNFLLLLFSSSFFSIILILVLILIWFGFFKVYFQKKEIAKEIFALEEEIKKLEGERSNLLKTLEYLKSDFYKEKEAREKLEMQKPGEKVIIILPEEEKEKTEEPPIYKKWWHLFQK
jgi:cell division protein FtsB